MMRRLLPVLVLSGLLGLGLLQACGPSQPNFSASSPGGGAAGGGAVGGNGAAGASSTSTTTTTGGTSSTSSGGTGSGTGSGTTTAGTVGSGGSSSSAGVTSGSGSTTGQPPFCATIDPAGPFYTVGVTWELPPGKGCGNFRNEGVTTMRLQTSDGESVDVPCEGSNPDAGFRSADIGHLSQGYWGIAISAIDGSGNILYSDATHVAIIDGDETIGFALAAGTATPVCGVPHR